MDAAAGGGRVCGVQGGFNCRSLCRGYTMKGIPSALASRRGVDPELVSTHAERAPQPRPLAAEEGVERLPCPPSAEKTREEGDSHLPREDSTILGRSPA